MIIVEDIIQAIEEFAPLAAQEPFDNSGLLVGRREQVVGSAIVCVDVSDAVFDEAVELGAGMIISHHPLIFNPLRSLASDNYPERLVERAIRENIAIYAAHTNLDAAPQGMSYSLARELGVLNPKLLSPTGADMPGYGYGVVGELEESVGTVEFLTQVRRKLGTGAIRHSAICTERVKSVALCTGSGGGHIECAIAAGADIYLAADFKYNHFIEADGRITVADIGHFESEYCAIGLLCDIITKKMPTFVLHKSVNARNPVNYSV